MKKYFFIIFAVFSFTNVFADERAPRSQCYINGGWALENTLESKIRELDVRLESLELYIRSDKKIYLTLGKVDRDEYRSYRSKLGPAYSCSSGKGYLERVSIDKNFKVANSLKTKGRLIKGYSELSSLLSPTLSSQLAAEEQKRNKQESIKNQEVFKPNDNEKKEELRSSEANTDESPDAADTRDFAITMQQAYQPEDESPDAADTRDFAITMQQVSQPEDIVSREDIKYKLYIQKSDFSNAELGYHPCNFKTNGSLGHHQDEKPVDISPENRDKLKAYLMSKACYYGGWVNLKQKGSNQEMDFDSAASAFLDTYAGSSPLCITGKLKHLCLGGGSYHSGIFIGEWENGMPNGQGVALITSNFPGFSGGYNNREGLFKGAFKNGYPHGSGYYTDGKKTYDGGWHSGEMHGDIGWIYPPSVVYGFRYDFDYESGLLKIIHITEGSPAEQAGMKAGDTILAYQLGENSQIKEIQSIPMDIFSDEINRSKQILLHINSLGNIFNIQKSEIYTYYASYSDCVNNTNKAHGCKEKAKLNNRYTGNVGYGAHNGAYAKGSFKMGTRHSYDQWDRHTVYYNDGTNGSLGFFCDGGATPWIGGDYNTTSGTSENAISHEGSSNVWMQPNFYISPCIAKNAAMVYPELILENEKLLEKSWSEIKQNNIQMRKIDFTYLLKEAIEQKDSLALWDERKFNLKSLGVGWSEDKIHALCQYSSTIMNNSCRSLRPSDSSLDKIRSKIAMNPMTKANKTKNQQQLAHAKFNYAFLKKTCKGLSGYQCASTGHSLLIHKQYWRCKYFGYPDITCLQKIDDDKKYNEIFNYIKDNPEEFINIDFSEWLLGKELEF